MNGRIGLMGNDLISLRANLDRWQQRDTLLAKSVECYLEALNGVEEHVLVPCAQKVAGRPPTLEDARKGLCRQPEEAAFEQARSSLETALQEASVCIRQQMAGSVELGEVLRLLAQTTSVLRVRSAERESSVKDVADELHGTLQLNNVLEFRSRIQAQVKQLNQIVEQMRVENQQMVKELEEEMTGYRRKLDEAEVAANSDTLTGMSNRRVLQVRVEEHIRSGARFCLLMIDLNRFKGVNDTYGHLAGDEVLRAFASRLRKHLRPNDVATRWGGDEFAVVLPVPLPEAIARGRELEKVLGGEYKLQIGSQSLFLKVGISFGVAEHRAGESADKLLARADELLYAAKAGRR